ncbi:MAG: hypothetical protein WBE75_03755 [Candidatus Omnitrophota bacterium]
MKRLIVVSAVVNSILLFWSTVNGETIPAKNINIPAQYGIVKEVYDAPSGLAQGRPVIIHIQDAHCNYEAQKNMAQLLAQLVESYKLHLIMVEGGSGDVNISFLRGYSDKKARQEVADKYLKEGKLSGEEYLDIISDYDIDLYGIDDDELYEKNLSAFLKIDSIRQQGVSYLRSLSVVINKLKPVIYSDELMTFEGKQEAYQDKRLSLVEYCLYLRDTVEKKKLELDGYPNLTLFLTICGLEKNLDLKKAGTERNAFVRELAGLLDEPGVQELVDKSKSFKEGKCAPSEYYVFLESKASGKLDISAKYPELSRYLKYLSASRGVAPSRLLKEIKSVEEGIHSSFLSGEGQKRLSDIDAANKIMINLWNLELFPEDYKYFKAHPDKFDVSSWTAFLAEQSRKYALPAPPRQESAVKDNLRQVDEFYSLGIDREDVFIRNIDIMIKEARSGVAVVIAGGFHTPGLTQRLRDRGYGYVVVAPVITKNTGSNTYFSILKSQGKAEKD